MYKRQGLGDSVAALFSGTWDAEAVKEKLGDNMGVAALPTVTIDGKEGQMKSFIGSKAIGVNPNAENQQVAMSLAAYLAGEKAQTAHYLSLIHIYPQSDRTGNGGWEKIL